MFAVLLVKLVMILRYLLLGCLLGLAACTGPALFPPYALPSPSIGIDYVEPAAVQPEEGKGTTLWFDNFDAGGKLQSPQVDYNSKDGRFVASTSDKYGSKGMAMRARFQRGDVDAGALQIFFGDSPVIKGTRTKAEPVRQVYWRIYVKHQRGWTGNPMKLSRATVLADSNWAQAMIAHVWGEGDVLVIDPASGVSNDRLLTTKYNDFSNLRWLGIRRSEYPLFATESSGRWICIEAEVKLNTPGAADGTFRLWIDGREEAHRTDLNWVGSWSERGLNGVFLENYWNDGSPVDQERYIDNFVIATEPIGPILATDPIKVMRAQGRCDSWEIEVGTDDADKTVVFSSTPIRCAERTFEVAKLPTGTYWLRIRSSEGGSTGRWSEWQHPFRYGPQPTARSQTRYHPVDNTP